MRESGEMEDTESKREENGRGRGGETGMYHLVLKNRGNLSFDYILGFRAFLIQKIVNSVSFNSYSKGYFNMAKLVLDYFYRCNTCCTASCKKE